MPSESEFQSFFKYNRWMLAINAIMIFTILCIMIWIAVTVNSKVKEIQNIINLLKNPLDKISEYLLKILPKTENTVLNTKDALINAKNNIVSKKNTILNNLSEIRTIT